MATPYESIYDKFIKRIKNDDHFLNYKDLSDEEVEELVNDHLFSLISRSVDIIYQYDLPDINLYDRDELQKQFNDDLTPQEISLLSELMYFCYKQEDINKLKVFEANFRSSELNLFSPANNRKAIMDTIEKIEADIVNSINNYFSRDRLTWNQKSVYQSSESS